MEGKTIMPKERLNAERTEQHSTENQLPGSDRVEGHVWDEMLPVVSLHWQEGYAQLGVKLDIATVRRALETLSDGASYVELFTPCLERREMNAAIKHLRRARNTVHGADE